MTTPVKRCTLGPSAISSASLSRWTSVVSKTGTEIGEYPRVRNTASYLSGTSNVADRSSRHQ
ncbi:hypothetical protein PISMIDRAFT_688072 [Pisolithus microcarpus 441]|uniref:Uncharacterized protein n=1 Tax=Pisolithus microcarpus 441 TaxID=765257 RepID=A0A0C9XPL3_9AGAM|nr:hypothetical protein PISMIDRAFT_688072 [Pisolithus microcarpus 441]